MERFRTTGVRMDLNAFSGRDITLSTDLNLFTGDPGLNWDDRIRYEGTGRHAGRRVCEERTNAYRMGVLYSGINGLRVGADSERIRHAFQNRFAHVFLMRGKSPQFLIIDKQPRFYWSYDLINTGLWAY